MNISSPYRGIPDKDFARLPTDLPYSILYEGACSECPQEFDENNRPLFPARECLHCTPPKLLCKNHYKLHLTAY